MCGRVAIQTVGYVLCGRNSDKKTTRYVQRYVNKPRKQGYWDPENVEAQQGG